MTPDTTVEKVGEVVKNALLAKARPETFKVHTDLKMLQASMLSLKRYRVRNIFAPLMVDFFPARNAQHQRDIGKVLSIIDAVALLHQHQRPVQTDSDGDEYLLASVEDNVIGLMLCDLVLRASLSGVPDDTWTVYQQMTVMEESKRPLTEDNILQWLGIHAFTISKNALKEKHLPTLEDAGLIEVGRRGGGRGGGVRSPTVSSNPESDSWTTMPCPHCSWKRLRQTCILLPMSILIFWPAQSQQITAFQ